MASRYVQYYAELNVENIAKHFHTRYQDEERYRHLCHQDNYKDTDEILLKPYENITHKEKIILLTYVVYRYRNNIFHGNKGIRTWSNYNKQIQYCLQYMMAIVDCHERHEEENA